MTWARGVAVRANVRNGKELELLITKELGWPKDEATNLLGEYLAGKRICFTTWSPSASSIWVERAEKIWSGSGDWFRTPVWYLMEAMQYTPGQVMACAQVLPFQFKDLLLHEPLPESPAGLLLCELWPNRIYEFSRPESVWALGALACAFRRAELAGQGPVYLRAGIGMVWMLDRLAQREAPWVREPILLFQDLILSRLKKVVYPGSTPIRIRISEREINRFGVMAAEYFEKKFLRLEF